MTTDFQNFSDLSKNEGWDLSGMPPEELYRSFAVLDKKMNVIYKFVLGYNDYINMRHNLTFEEIETMYKGMEKYVALRHPESKDK
mgnify:CR=1 FL=1